MKKCFSPYKKYVISALAGPILGLGLFTLMAQFENVKFLFPIMMFCILFLFPLLLVLPNFVACPKCEQKIGCSKENCFDWTGGIALTALLTNKCKKCGHDLSLCEDEKNNR